jgi:hypothetical protein
MKQGRDSSLRLITLSLLLLSTLALFCKQFVIESLFVTSETSCSVLDRPTARCPSAANAACRDFDMFKTKNVSLDHILL